MKRRSFISLSFLFAIVLIFTSCIKEGLRECEQILYLHLNWIETEPTTEEGNPVTVDIMAIDEEGEYSMQSSVDGTQIPIYSGKLLITGYETAENAHIDIREQTVYLDALDDGTVVNEPGYFSAGSTEVEVMPGESISETIDLPLYKQVRKLIIELKFEGEGASLINQVSGYVDGIALNREINYGFSPVDKTITRPPANKAGKMSYAFARSSSLAAVDEVIYSDGKNLLGIDGNAKQLLTFTATFKKGETYMLIEDITELMNGFHTEGLDENGSDKPWYVKISFSVDTDLNISIQDWENGGESWIEGEYLL